MAYEIPGFKDTKPAGADLSSAQYHFVELGSGATVTVCNAATDKPYGVLQNNPLSGHAAELMLSGVSKVVAGADLAVGDLVGTDSSGRAVALVPGTDTTKYAVGRVILENTATGGIASIAFDCLAMTRAA